MKIYQLFRNGLIILLLLLGCSKNDDLTKYSFIKKNPDQVYIYDERLIPYDSCQIIGTIDYHFVNRKCSIYNGYFHIGTSNVYNKSEYFVELMLYPKDTMFSIRKNKLIWKKLQ